MRVNVSPLPPPVPNHIKWRRGSGFASVIALITITTALLLLPQGCAPPPIPGELLTAQRLYNNARVDDELKTLAPHLWQRHEEYYLLADKLWQKRETVEAKEAARIATIIYNTATAEVNRIKAQKQIDALKQQLAEARLSADMQRRTAASLSDEVAYLRNSIRLAKEIEELRRNREIERLESERRLAKQKALADEKIRYGVLLMKLKEAESKGAPTHAKELFNVAVSSMDKANAALNEENLPAATASLDMAEDAIQQAMDWASPIHQAEQSRQNQADTANSLLAKATALSNLQVLNEPRGVVLVVEDVFGTSTKTNRAIQPKGATRLEAISNLLRDYPGMKITVEGHTDNTMGTDAAQELTATQAMAVKEFIMVRAGLDSTMISPMGYGNKANVADNSTPDQRRKNRRIEVIIHTNK